MKRTCYYCNCEFPVNELRPYGPNQSYVCYPCATSTPDRVDATTQTFLNMLDDAHQTAEAAGTCVILCTPDGPQVQNPKTLH